MKTLVAVLAVALGLADVAEESFVAVGATSATAPVPPVPPGKEMKKK